MYKSVCTPHLSSVEPWWLCAYLSWEVNENTIKYFLSKQEIAVYRKYTLSLFQSLRKAGKDVRLLRLSIMVFLSYLPEAGQYSCFFLYLQKVSHRRFIFSVLSYLITINICYCDLYIVQPRICVHKLFNLQLHVEFGKLEQQIFSFHVLCMLDFPEYFSLARTQQKATAIVYPLLIQVVGLSLNQVALFIAILCVTSVAAQTLGLSWLMACFGYKYTIIIGLVFQAVQLFIYGVWTAKWYVHVCVCVSL